jgi:hypothetical protein
MLRSLTQHDPDTDIFALCFDEITCKVISELGLLRVFVVSTDMIRHFEPRLADFDVHSRKAFYATHKPVLPLYVFNRRPELTGVAHIDSDTFFYSSPFPIFAEIGEASIAVSPHRFSEPYENLHIYGQFNAGFIYWRNDAEGRRCLLDYRDDCFEWCEPHVEADGRFMNQGYLTAWPQRYPGVHIVEHAGANLSWWNVARHRIAARDALTVDGMPLIFYHFSSVFRDQFGVWRTYSELGDDQQFCLQAIYRPYLEEVERIERWLREREPTRVELERGADPKGTTWVYRGGGWTGS